MILSFSVENFKSIKERQSLIFTPRTTQKGELKDNSLDYSHVYEIGHYQVLKGAAIYGANASGKSNVLQAMLWMRKIVLQSTAENLEEESLSYTPFLLSEETLEEPVVMEIEILIDDVKYQYGFAYIQNEIVEEWLFRKKHGIKQVRLFHREKQNFNINTAQFGKTKDLITKTRERVLFLRVCAEWNHSLSESIVGWYRSCRAVSGLVESRYFDYTAKRLQKSKYRESILKLTQQAGLGYGDIKSISNELEEADLPKHLSREAKRNILENNRQRYDIVVQKKIFDAKGIEVDDIHFDLKTMESKGSQKLVSIAGPLDDTLERGSVLIIDEFEAKLHPNLTKEIIKWFFGPANKNGAQIIFATHDVGIMDAELLRRDQIWFCEKDQEGATELYCLDEFDPQQVRKGSRFDKQYLKGVFGAVPHIALNDH